MARKSNKRVARKRIVRGAAIASLAAGSSILIIRRRRNHRLGTTG